MDQPLCATGLEDVAGLDVWLVGNWILLRLACLSPLLLISVINDTQIWPGDDHRKMHLVDGSCGVLSVPFASFSTLALIRLHHC